MDPKTARTWKKEIEKHISSIKEGNTVIRIFNIIDPVRVEMDSKDFAPINGIENAVRKLHKNNYRKLCIIDLNDILDWNVKKYDEAQAAKIINALEQIKEIHDRTFWEKLIAVFRGS